ncbi:MAG: cheB2 [Moraxellaceae bacterium]|nr:cheB2 [Moraxellaceae bacterium]
MSGTTAPIRVLAVDDSAVARNAYRLLLTPELGFDLIATAPDAGIARRKIAALRPDVVILDIEMPGEDGLTFLEWLMQHQPTPVVVSSSYSSRGAEQTMRAFSLGAVEVVCKGGPQGVAGWGEDFSAILRAAVQAAARARHRSAYRSGAATTSAATPVAPVVPLSPRAIRRGNCVVIGASTGGTEALSTLVAQMPPDFPPTFIVQHMPPLYTRAFAQRLDTLGAVRVKEAGEGDMIGPGQALVAPGGMQLRMGVGHSGPVARVSPGPRVNRHAPSVDVLFDSAVEAYRSRVIGVLLTGMGNDGAEGLLHIREAGGSTVAQDEATCVVYGMPQEAVKRGAAGKVLPVDAIVPWIVALLAER